MAHREEASGLDERPLLRRHKGDAARATPFFRRPGEHPHEPHSSVAEPPAAAIFSLADSLNACAEMVSDTPPSSPEPSTLTSWPLRTAPASTSCTGPTSPPFGNSSARRSRVTTWKTTLFLFLKPFSFGRRM